MRDFLDKYFGTTALVAEFYSILTSLALTLLYIAEDRFVQSFALLLVLIFDVFYILKN